MDIDEILARQLQAEEAHHAQRLRGSPQVASSTAAQQEFTARLQSGVKQSMQYEDQMLQALALSVMPMEQLIKAGEDAAELSRSLGEQPVRAEEDSLAHELLHWFKHDFFTWVNSPACSCCGGQDMHASGGAQPTPEEAAAAAGRVELHSCRTCSAVTRFPRYNDPGKLLETRQGRCGEWANCFTLCCRAAGLTARYVVDWTDHVWTEYFSHAHRRWIHLDPCEAAYDQPLLYEAGWGKKLTYVIAFSPQGVTDVVRRYTKQWDDLRTRRNAVREEWLSQRCKDFTADCRRQWSAEEQQVWQERDRQEQAQLAGHTNAPITHQEQALPGRQTGSEAWRAARGEIGSGTSQQQQGTAFAAAQDVHVSSSVPGRWCGGVVRASGQHAPHETALKAFDGSPNSKWLDFGAANQGTAWLEYRCMPDQDPVTLTHYTLMSADDEPNRDPCDFSLEGYLECAVSTGSNAQLWKQLDKQQGVIFPGRRSLLHFQLGTSLPCRSYRLNITAVRNPAAANSVQLAQLNLHHSASAPQEAPAALSDAAQLLQTAAKEQSGTAAPAFAKALETLLLVLVNVAQHPEEAKFRTLKSSNARVQAMLSSSPCFEAVLAAAGFQKASLSRTGKLPPEAAWALDNNPIALQSVSHTLRLLQTPTRSSAQQLGHALASIAQAPGSAGPAADASFTDATAPIAVTSQVPDEITNAGLPESQTAPDATEPRSDATGQIPGSIGNAVGQQSQSASAQLPSKSSASLASGTSAPAGVGLTLLPAELDTSKTKAVASNTSCGPDNASGTSLAIHSETPTSQARVAESNAAGSQPTTAVAQSQAAQNGLQCTPAAGLQQQSNAPPLQQQGLRSRGDHTTSVQKAISFTPAVDQLGKPDNQEPTDTSVATSAAPVQTDIASLIRQKFSELMLTGKYTPNEAAVLAMKSVSQEHNS